jgi:Ca-activated chloride channel family protein
MFHFLRPEWLWGLLPLIGLFLLVAKRGASQQVWAKVCDAHLLPHLLVGTEAPQRHMPLVLLGCGWLVAIVALAGPVWSQLPQPVYRAESALVIVLDLSRSMDVQDVAPSRLTRAKHKILDILKLRKEGQTALVVYAGEPYVVSPLTDDANTMVTLVQSLETTLMPLQGSRPDLALQKANGLLKQVGHTGGHLLLVTDSEGDPATVEVVKDLHNQGRRVSVLGIGTDEGAPIPEPGGFLKDPEGNIVMPALDRLSLQALARTGGGRYATVTVDDRDVMQVLPSVISSSTMSSATSDQRTTDVWREEGPWLILLLLILALPAFRQGWLGMLGLFLLIPQVSEAGSWENLWSRPDQQGAIALERKAPEEAAALFNDPAWKGIALYRAGNYQEAEAAFSVINTAEGHYNRGNALAQLGRYEEAVASYEETLRQQPHHADAQHNLDLLKKLIRQASSTSQQASSSQRANTEKSGDGENNLSGQASNASQVSDKPQEPDSSTGAEANPAANPHQQSPDQTTAVNQERKNNAKPQDGETGQPHDSISSASLKSDSSGEQMEPSEGTSTASAEHLPGTQNSEQVLRQWLRRIPDDPGGLLRRKFLLEHQRRLESGTLQSRQERQW